MGNSDETCTLREYLGLNEEEEDVWISDSDEALEDLLEAEAVGRAGNGEGEQADMVKVYLKKNRRRQR